jgi:hypothetical protein
MEYIKGRTVHKLQEISSTRLIYRCNANTNHEIVYISYEGQLFVLLFVLFIIAVRQYHMGSDQVCASRDQSRYQVAPLFGVVYAAGTLYSSSSELLSSR